MTFDPQLAAILALVMAVAWTMTFSGLKKNMLEQRQRRRVCPSCGRDIDGPVCRAH